MWVVAGVLLGAVVVSSLLGLHIGPHGHVLAGVLGLVAAGWLLAMGLSGNASSLLWALLVADVVVASGAGVVAWKGLTTPASHGARASTDVLARPGVAVTALCPDGIVRVGGENWSATSLNGDVAPGAAVQVVGRQGVHLEVWGEDNARQSPDSARRALLTDSPAGIVTTLPEHKPQAPDEAAEKEDEL